MHRNFDMTINTINRGVAHLSSACKLFAPLMSMLLTLSRPAKTPSSVPNFCSR